MIERELPLVLVLALDGTITDVGELGVALAVVSDATDPRFALDGGRRATRRL